MNAKLTTKWNKESSLIQSIQKMQQQIEHGNKKETLQLKTHYNSIKAFLFFLSNYVPKINRIFHLLQQSLDINSVCRLAPDIRDWGFRRKTGRPWIKKSNSLCEGTLVLSFVFCIQLCIFLEKRNCTLVNMNISQSVLDAHNWACIQLEGGCTLMVLVIGMLHLCTIDEEEAKGGLFLSPICTTSMLTQFLMLHVSQQNDYLLSLVFDAW